MQAEKNEEAPIASTSAAEGPLNRFGNCEVCAVIQAKYCCPRCEVKTCSLKCATIHKKELDCSGSRDRAKYIPLNKFTNLDLSSDYRLLEEINRKMETCKKNRAFYGHNDATLPNHLFKLRKTSLNRKTNLMIQPYNFHRHKINSTKVDFVTDTIFWHIEWVFFNAENLKLTDKKISENEKMSNVLVKYFKESEDSVINNHMQFYVSLGISNVKVLMKAEGKAGRKFYELDIYSSFKDNFRKKTIIEFPTLYVVLKEHVYGMDVIDSDDEDFIEESKVGSAVVNNIIKKSESDESVYKSLKNLLFINSSDEMSE